MYEDTYGLNGEDLVLAHSIADQMRVAREHGDTRDPSFWDGQAEDGFELEVNLKPSRDRHARYGHYHPTNWEAVKEAAASIFASEHPTS